MYRANTGMPFKKIYFVNHMVFNRFVMDESRVRIINFRTSKNLKKNTNKKLITTFSLTYLSKIAFIHHALKKLAFTTYVLCKLIIGH